MPGGCQQSNYVHFSCRLSHTNYELYDQAAVSRPDIFRFLRLQGFRLRFFQWMHHQLAEPHRAVRERPNLVVPSSHLKYFSNIVCCCNVTMHLNKIRKKTSLIISLIHLAGQLSWKAVLMASQIRICLFKVCCVDVKSSWVLSGEQFRTSSYFDQKQSSGT